jgi:hypothetical protein
MGIGAIIGFIGYIFLFTYIRIKYFNDTIENPFDLILMPFLAPLIIVMIALVPLVIGVEVTSWWT